MTEIEAKQKDLILTKLLELKGSAVNIRSLSRVSDLEIYQVKSNLYDLINSGKVDRIGDDSEKLKDGSVIYINSKGENFINTSSYLSLWKSEKDSQKKTQRSKTTIDVIKIGITILFGLSAAILGWLTFSRNQTIKEQETVIKNFEIQLDSLKKELNNVRQQ